MKRNLIIVSVIIIIILIIIVVVYNGSNHSEVKENINNEIDNTRIINGIKENISENLNQTKNVENLEITDIKLSREEETTKFLAIVHNNTETKFDGSNAIVSLINNDGKTYYELSIYIPEINSNDTGEINAALPEDITDAYDFKITLVK